MMNRTVFPVNSSLSTWIVVRDADNTDTNRRALHLKHFAIITQDQFLGTDLQITLFVAISGTIERVIHRQILRRVWIRTEADVGCMGELRKSFQSS
jgi:hypothetical protein